MMDVCLPPKLLAFLAMLAVGVPAAQGTQQDATITVDGSTPVHNLSTTLYGIFFEEINFAGDGGLYAELIRNRDFEALGRGNLGGDQEKVPIAAERDRSPYMKSKSEAAVRGPIPQPDYTNYKPWQAVGSSAVLYLDNTTHPFATNPTTLAVRFSPTARGTAGVANPGFWGIPVPEQASSFNLTFYARAVGVDDGSAGPDGFVRYPLEASLRDPRTGAVLAIAPVVPVRGDGKWRQYTAVLATPAGVSVDAATFFLTSGGGGGDAWPVDRSPNTPKH